MGGCSVGAGSYIERAIIDENSSVGAHVVIGCGDNIPNEQKPGVYDTGITVVGEDSAVPDNATIGKNCVIYGISTPKDYPNMVLESGKSIIHEKEVSA
jgi:glucose-1-phosphate adenylyltransferase